MYVPPFWAGVIFTILAEVIIAIIAVSVENAKGGKE